MPTLTDKKAKKTGAVTKRGERADSDDFSDLLAGLADSEPASASASAPEAGKDDFDSLLAAVGASGGELPGNDSIQKIMDMQAVLSAVLASTTTPSEELVVAAHAAVMALRAALPEAERAQQGGQAPSSRAHRATSSRMRPRPGRSRVRGAASRGAGVVSRASSNLLSRSRFGRSQTRSRRAGLTRVGK